jgi:hypothetical protein
VGLPQLDVTTRVRPNVLRFEYAVTFGSSDGIVRSWRRTYGEGGVLSGRDQMYEDACSGAQLRFATRSLKLNNHRSEECVWRSPFGPSWSFLRCSRRGVVWPSFLPCWRGGRCGPFCQAIREHTGKGHRSPAPTFRIGAMCMLPNSALNLTWPSLTLGPRRLMPDRWADPRLP